MLEIELWYGSWQRFGHLGQPQRWINILGTVKDTVSLRYSLNGSEALPLSLGKDTLRLAEPGDFNVEIACTSLREGNNEVVLMATNNKGQSVRETVYVEYTSSQTWLLPYSVDWSNVSAIGDAAQIVDGRWQLSKNGIRTVNANYDRLITLGDTTWRDYQLTLQATIHDFFIEPDHPWADGGLEGGFGLLFRWSGHYVDEYQPHREWRPNGAIGWYRARWEEKPAKVRCLNISDAVVQDRVMVETEPLELTLNQPYMFQFSVKSQEASSSFYRYRVWSPDKPDDLLCDLSCHGKEGEAPTGSILLVCLFADVTIGTIKVEAI
jgi:hypothetical protein